MIKEEMWIEKHRPKTLDDIIGHETAIRVLKAFVKSGNSMNLLLEGPAGTGKTATALAIVKDLYGENWERNFMELNASDQRGIDVVRNEIKNFSVTQAVGEPFKIILLDEMDELCLPEGTEILTGCGKREKYFEKIEEISQDKYTIMSSVNLKNGKIEKDKGMCIDSGYADFYKLTFDNGKEVIASEKHPFFCYDNNKKLIEIKMKDLDVDSEILDFQKDLGLGNCLTCGKVINSYRKYCSIDCKDKGHSELMTGEGNPRHGKPSWSRGLTKKDNVEQYPGFAKMGVFGDDNVSKRLDVKLKKQVKHALWWHSISEEEKRDYYEKTLGIACKAITGKTYEEYFGEDRAYEERAKRSIHGVEGFKDSNYRRLLRDNDEEECEVCGEMFKTNGHDGIYVHHIDENHDNNERSNLKFACPRCHNLKLHDRMENFIEKGWEITHQPKYLKHLCLDGVNCPEYIKVIKKEYVGKQKAYNITMLKNPCFFLRNGILTHNTSFAQAALRRTMERSSSTCRFLFSCNHANKLIDPIHSRVGVVHFGGLTNDNLKQLITKISEKENVNITPEAVELLIELTPPDGRKIINNLQMCAILGEEITPELVRQIIRVPEKGIIKQILDNTLNGDMDKAIEISTSHIINSGFDINGILRMIMNIIPTLELENHIQSKFYDVIKETEHYINSGDSIHIQFNGMLARMALVSKMGTKEA